MIPTTTTISSSSSSLPLPTTTTTSQQTLHQQQQQQQQSKRRSSSWWFKVGCIILIIVISIEYRVDWNLSMLSSSSTSSNVEKTKEESGSVGDGKQQQPQPQQICNPIINNSNNNNHSAIILSDITSVTLHRGELPGYTGWARPEFTLANYFSIVSFSTTQPMVGNDFRITIRCQGHVGCENNNNNNNNNSNKSQKQNLFYLRAYGPSVIAGKFMNGDGGDYVLQFHFLDPGVYTVEAIMTFSNTPSFDQYPLRSDIHTNEPYYEGYSLPGFPLQVRVSSSSDSSSFSSSSSFDSSLSSSHSQLQPQQEVEDAQQRYCSSFELTEQSSSSALRKARWKVKSKTNMPGYTSGTIDYPISEDGYKHNIHSIGIQMTYEYTNCTLLPKSVFSKRQGKNNPFYQCGGASSGSDQQQQQQKRKKKLIVIYIGDSVMRIQRNMFDGYIKSLDKDVITVKTVMIELYTGYRRCEKLVGPNIRTSLQELEQQYANDDMVILFNTGLHDIHRLCGQEFAKDRYEYLTDKKAELTLGTFQCVEEYRTLLQEFVSLIRDFPAQLRVFQSTTAGWPKYGNYNVGWPYHRGQNLPLSPDIVSHFNEIAYDEISSQEVDNRKHQIHIMDGYWITYSRPDNREVGDIGHKLSHPGLEVQSAMVKIWIMLLLEKMC